MNNQSQSHSQIIIATILGVTFIIFMLVFSVIIPLPTSYQSWVFRIVLSLSAAALASILSGSIYFKNKFLKVTGPLAIFVIVFFSKIQPYPSNNYLINPDVQIKIEQLKKASNDLRKENNNLQKKNNSLYDKYNDLQKKHDTLQEKHNVLREEYDIILNTNAKVKVQQLEKENLNLNLEIQELKKENLNLKKDIGILSKQDSKEKKSIWLKLITIQERKNNISNTLAVILKIIITTAALFFIIIGFLSLFDEEYFMQGIVYIVIGLILFVISAYNI